MAWVTGYEGGPPIIPGGPVDPMVGAHAALAIVAALEHRDRTGEGQLVEVPLLEVATAVTAEQVIRYSIDGTLLDRRGTGGVYRDARRRRVGRGRPRVRPDAGRRARAEWCATRDAGSGRGRAARRRASRPRRWCPATRRSTIRSCAHAGSSRRSTIRTSGAQEYPTWPMRMSAGPARYWTGPAPTLGQHTDEVLRDELGVTDDELARLRDAARDRRRARTSADDSPEVRCDPPR